jgi:uncharacterized protein YkwD
MKFSRLLAAFITASIVMGSTVATAGYRDYAQGVVASLGEAKARPDLEALLDRMASGYRRKNGRPTLEASDMMRVAARAQAADMMAMGKSKHVSRKGHRFGTRFEAFATPDMLIRVKGENAASDRYKGPADKSKAQRLFQSWLDSGGHRRNLMQRDYAFVSTGVIQRGDELWAVQIFWSAPEDAQPSLLFQID